MYRLMIIDDERYIVESLTEMFLAQKDLDLDIMTAYYGDEALEMLKTRKADIVLMDIRMPGLSGIETAKRLLADWPLCRVIFLTGYASFEYIYEINQMPNSSFLLKTEGSEAIITAVKQAIVEIEEQRNYQRLLSTVELLQYQMKYLLYADIFRDLLNGKRVKDQNNLMLQKDHAFPFDTGRNLYLFYLKMRWLRANDSQGDFHQHIASITGLLSRQLNGKCNLTMTDVDTETFAVFLQPCADAQISMHADYFSYICECLNDGIASFPDYQLLLLVRQQEVRWEDLATAYQFYHQYYLQCILPNFPQYGQIIICDEDNLDQGAQENFLYMQNTEKKILAQLSAGLHNMDEMQINKALDRFHTIFPSGASMQHIAVVRLYHKISDLFIEYIMQYQLEENLSQKIGLYRLYSLDRLGSWDKLISYYKKLASILMQTVSSEETDSRERIIEQIQTFIQKNLHRNLSLVEIANVVNYNSSYISRLFKQMTGENLFQYILQVKMEKAKEYLARSNESIQQIAEKLGYDSSQYFSSVFKKQTGFSPRDYRNRSM